MANHSNLAAVAVQMETVATIEALSLLFLYQPKAYQTVLYKTVWFASDWCCQPEGN